jgi:pyruvate,orthophosphate dikinase
MSAKPRAPLPPAGFRFIHTFDSSVDAPAILGGKGASLARMQAYGLPTPSGFTIGTDGWRAYRQAGECMPDQILAELDACVDWLGATSGRALGDCRDPLLVSVRSGAPVSMPGMMDTILNLGLGDDTTRALAQAAGATFAWQLYKRLLETFATVVRGLDAADVAAAVGAEDDVEQRCEAIKTLIEARSARPFPQAPREQLIEAVEAVWRSWDSRRARRYRRYAGIPDDLGTAVTVQAMVFGTYDDQSGTGVVFTRDPSTGSPQPYGDYLARAQGEDVVAGIHDTEPLSTMRASVPAAYAELELVLPTLEAAYRDMCDVEFTVERGKLWVLQARAGQRSGAAAVRIAVDLVDEGLIDVDEALSRIPLSAMAQLQAPVFAREQHLDVLGEGIPAAPGAAVGAAVFDAERAQQLAGEGVPVVLVRPETSPQDIAGMIAATGIVTAVGGRTSHAAVVARGIGRPAVCGVKGLNVDPIARRAAFSGRVVEEGQPVAVDGQNGIVVLGEVRLVPAQPDPRVARVLAWCDERARVPVQRNPPAGYVTVSAPDAVDGNPTLIDVEWAGPGSAVLVDRIVEAVLAQGTTAVALRLPESLTEGDLRPAPAPWTALVAAPEVWPARLLATRLEPHPAA